MINDQDKEVDLIALDKNGAPKQRRRGPAKPKKITTAPTHSEWQELGRDAFEAMKSLVLHRDPDTDLPTAPVSLYSTIATVMKTIDSTVDKSAENANMDTLQENLKQKRLNRRIVGKDVGYTDDEIEKVRRSQVETGAINVDEPATLPILPWSQANTLDEE